VTKSPVRHKLQSIADKTDNNNNNFLSKNSNMFSLMMGYAACCDGRGTSGLRTPTRRALPRPAPQNPKATAEGLFPDWLNVRSVYRQRPSLTTYYELLYYSKKNSKENYELDY